MHINRATRACKLRYMPSNPSAIVSRRLRGAIAEELQDLVLAFEDVDLLLRHRVKRGERFVIGLRAGVLGRRDHVLPDDDDWQENELKEVR